MTTRPTGTRTSASKTAAAKTQTRKAAPKSAATRAAPQRPARAGAQQADMADSPVLPVEQLQALGKIKPGAVDWVIEQTQLEAEHRRSERVRVNNLIFIEHVFAQTSALIIGVAGIAGGVWLAGQGQPWVGVGIAAVVMVALAVVQVGARAKR